MSRQRASERDQEPEKREKNGALKLIYYSRRRLRHWLSLYVSERNHRVNSAHCQPCHHPSPYKVSPEILWCYLLVYLEHMHIYSSAASIGSARSKIVPWLFFGPLDCNGPSASHGNKTWHANKPPMQYVKSLH